MLQPKPAAAKTGRGDSPQLGAPGGQSAAAPGPRLRGAAAQLSRCCTANPSSSGQRGPWWGISKASVQTITLLWLLCFHTPSIVSDWGRVRARNAQVHQECPEVQTLADGKQTQPTADSGGRAGLAVGAGFPGPLSVSQETWPSSCS